MDTLFFTVIFFWEVLTSKWTWLLAAVLTILAFLLDDVRHYLPFGLLLFIPALVCFWIFVWLYVRRLKKEDTYVEQGVMALWQAAQGDWAGTAEEVANTFKPGWLARQFLGISWPVMHLPVGALVAVIALAVINRFIG